MWSNDRTNHRTARVLVTAFTAAALSLPVLVAEAPAAMADHGCDVADYTWPLCEFSAPSIPRFDVQGPRPDLTPKESPWCRDAYIKADRDGHAYWVLRDSIKHDLSFWPDYYDRSYQAVYWDRDEWVWATLQVNYTRTPVLEWVSCDA